MEKTTALFKLDVEKKHSVVYKEDTPDGAFTIAASIYFSKAIVGNANFPKTLRVTVEEAGS